MNVNLLKQNKEVVIKDIVEEAWGKIEKENLAEYTTLQEVENKIRKHINDLIAEYDSNDNDNINNEK